MWTKSIEIKECQHNTICWHFLLKMDEKEWMKLNNLLKLINKNIDFKNQFINIEKNI